MSERAQLTIVTPPVAATAPDTDLVNLTEFILPYDERRAREEVIYRELTARYGLSMHGCAVHCTCSRPQRYKARFDAAKLGPDGHAPTCGVVRPNFVHKPSGIEVRWYKWIGRDVEWSRKPGASEWRRIFAECVDSLQPQPSPTDVTHISKTSAD